MTVKTDQISEEMKASLFRKALERLLRENKDAPDAKLNEFLYKLFKTICEYSTDESRAIGMQFSTLFSQIAYLGEAFHLKGWFTYSLHTYRKESESRKRKFTDKELTELGIFCIENLIRVIFEGKAPEQPNETAGFAQKLHLRKLEKEKSTFKKHMRVYLSSIDDPGEVKVIAEDYPAEPLTLKYNDIEQDESLAQLIEYLSNTKNSLPTTLSLVNVKVIDEKEAIPEAIVWQPDYLIDVTTISECFDGNEFKAVKYITHRFLSTENNPYILAGLITNYFLDQLLINPNLTYNELLKESFKLYPIPYTAMTAENLETCIDRIKQAFYILRETIHKDLKQIIRDESSYKLEPSFIAPPYGIQGRLDLLSLSDKQINIVELKSGSPFRPNSYGLSYNHYVQTLLYNLLIEYAYMENRPGTSESVKAHILYARQTDNPLRYAPRVNALLMKALNMRNRLLMVDHHLQSLNDMTGASLFDRLRVDIQTDLKGFDRENIAEIEKTWKGLDDTEKQYLKAFIGYAAREQRYAKLGTPGSFARPGMAGMWLHSNPEKTTEFNLLEGLLLLEDNSGNEKPTVTFKRNENESKISNFRIGDIVTLYPHSDILFDKIQFEIYKSTIQEISSEQVTLRLRSKQPEGHGFTPNSRWNIEHDLMESSFSNIYQNLLKWGKMSKRTRRLFMGRIPPAQQKAVAGIRISQDEFKPQMSDEQFQLLQMMLNAEDYFLLWGPPGTGKTSFMLKNYVQALVEHTEESIILLAYTNRAVDEICAAIESISEGYRHKYIRVGSSLSTDEEYKDRLLQNLIQDIDSRKELTEFLESHRIYVSTIASFAHNQELLSIKSFDRAFIDEASQLLDPMVVPVFSKVPRIIFTGDHKQLPAVSAQPDEEAEITNEKLTNIGFESTKVSIFERLYKRARAEAWDWAYGQLTYQGRMHEEIMQFPAPHFYENQLRIVKDSQRSELKEFYNIEHDSPLFQNRLVFIPTEVDKDNTRNSIRNYKVNLSEAHTIAQLVKQITDYKYKDNPEDLQYGIGVITPYRAQIAQIKAEIGKVVPEALDFVTVDTVERYQGSARDIIILSFCTQAASLFQLFSDTDISGINRKLNVAVTRAREQLIIVGNKEILLSSEIYEKLLEQTVEVPL